MWTYPNITRKPKKGGSEDRYPGKTTEKFFEQSGIRLGKLKS